MQTQRMKSRIQVCSLCLCQTLQHGVFLLKSQKSEKNKRAERVLLNLYVQGGGLVKQDILFL